MSAITEAPVETPVQQRMILHAGEDIAATLRDSRLTVEQCSDYLGRMAKVWMDAATNAYAEGEHVWEVVYTNISDLYLEAEDRVRPPMVGGR